MKFWFSDLVVRAFAYIANLSTISTKLFYFFKINEVFYQCLLFFTNEND